MGLKALCSYSIVKHVKSTTVLRRFLWFMIKIFFIIK